MTEAYVYWQAQGLVRIRGEAPLIVEYLDMEPSEASGWCRANTQTSSPRWALSSPRVSSIFVNSSTFTTGSRCTGLDEEAVLELVSHSMDQKGRRLSVNYIDAVARSWSEAGVVTRDAARAHLAKYELKKHGASEILRQWNKLRKPTKAETTLYEKWTGEWGFSQEAILAALPKLAVSGTPNFVYLDELLDGLRKEGQTSRPKIELADAKSAEKQGLRATSSSARASSNRDAHHTRRSA